MMRWGLSGAAFALACGAQLWVAADPVVHMLVQIPLLAICGWLLPLARWELPKEVVGAVLILALVVGAIWMLPRSLDSALITWQGHIAKFVTIPLLFGLPLALVWRHLGPILKGFLKCQSVSMLLFLGFLYTHAPVRLCNSYLVDDQVRLGHGFALAALALVILWLIPVFASPSHRETKGKFHEFSHIRH